MFIPGQRWISTAEPELGLGTILRVEGRGVQVLFAKAGVLRPYAMESAPLMRAEFRAGQRVAGKGLAFLVERVEIKDDLLIYRGEGRELHEGQLDDEQSVSQADERGHFNLPVLNDANALALQIDAQNLGDPLEQPDLGGPLDEQPAPRKQQLSPRRSHMHPDLAYVVVAERTRLQALHDDATPLVTKATNVRQWYPREKVS